MKQLSQRQIEITEIKLKEARRSVELFALDYDGTIYDGGQYKQLEVVNLIDKILTKNKSVAIITARAATALKVIAPSLKDLLSRNNYSAKVFIAGGNGTVLHGLTKAGLDKIYSHGLTVAEISLAVDSWKKIYKGKRISCSDLSEKGLNTFQNFLRDDWAGYIPTEVLRLCQPYNGEIFTEEAKVTFVLPNDKSLREEAVRSVQDDLGGDYSVSAGDNVYAHITKRLEEDGKIVAVKAVLKILELEENQVATFGDMPEDNDKGLLSFPFSFTNSNEFIGPDKGLKRSPYILLNPDSNPVTRVYEAVNFLLP